MEKPKVYSERMRGHGRHYFFNVRTAENGNSYLTLTASQKDKEKEGEYRQDRLIVFAEDVDAFSAALGRSVKQLHEHRLNGAISTPQSG